MTVIERGTALLLLLLLCSVVVLYACGGVLVLIRNREKEGSGPQEDKLTLACFNSGDVPELIGRLSVVLSHATHKVISLPMFRKDVGVSWWPWVLGLPLLAWRGVAFILGDAYMGLTPCSHGAPSFWRWKGLAGEGGVS